ncbi:hypothetical protein V6N11_060649 [Hibiscus sabdariffa]|uniref:RNase H type-1 domain-containing protein n=1 Tax=Hibiscus sabdariffa TaxID=183260 RepID=A0ABR2QQZ2_9ROSI
MLLSTVGPLPNIGWMKANCDGAVNLKNDMAAVGGVIRDGNGASIFGFTRRIGQCLVLIAELWVIHDILNHAWNIGLRNVELETDSLEAFRIINRSSSTLADTLLVEDLFELMS